MQTKHLLLVILNDTSKYILKYTVCFLNALELIYLSNQISHTHLRPLNAPTGCDV
jgi:hypothetical protein